MAQLKEFGLTTHGARAYVALLDLGVAEARAVSELANIPSAKVYGALVQLQKRGLAEVTPGKPRKYAPVPIAAFLERQLREQEERAEELRAHMAEIVDLFPVGGGVSLPDRPQTVTVEGRRNVMQHLREACERAEASIYAMLSPVLRSDFTVRRPFEEAAQRGVEVRLVEDIPMPETAACVVATFDERAALLVRLRRGQRKDGHASSAIFTTDPGFVAPLHRLLEFRRGAVSERAQERARVDARVDAATFERLVHEHAELGARDACAILHAAEATELERDRLWRAASGAVRTRVLLSPTSPRAVDPGLLERLPPTVEVRFLPRASAVAFTILDGHRAFFVSPARSARGDADEPLCAFTADPAVVHALSAQFEANWAMAPPLVLRRP